jgi:hypothetical protein
MSASGSGSGMMQVPGGGSALAPAPVTGGRRKSARKVSAKTIRKTLKHLGMKPKGRVVLKGGEDCPPGQVKDMDGNCAPAMGGRRRSRRASRGRRRSHGLKKLFGF